MRTLLILLSLLLSFIAVELPSEEQDTLEGQPCPLGQENDLSGRGLDPSHPNFEKTPPLREGSPNASPRREDEKLISDRRPDRPNLYEKNRRDQRRRMRRYRRQRRRIYRSDQEAPKCPPDCPEENELPTKTLEKKA